MDGLSVHQKIERLMGQFRSSFAVRDLVNFFQHNPGAVSTPSSLASRLKRAESEIRDVLEGLVEAQILARKEIAGRLYYVYRPDPVARLEIDKAIRRLRFQQQKLKTATERFRKSRPRSYW